MAYRVQLTAAARDDLVSIYDYIHDHDAPEKAAYVLGRIEEVVKALAETPDRGAVVPEMQRIGELRFRELFFKPYRVIYEVDSDTVIVYVIADGRRNLDVLLTRRLIRS